MTERGRKLQLHLLRQWWRRLVRLLQDLSLLLDPSFWVGDDGGGRPWSGRMPRLRLGVPPRYFTPFPPRDIKTTSLPETNIIWFVLISTTCMMQILSIKSRLVFQRAQGSCCFRHSSIKGHTVHCQLSPTRRVSKHYFQLTETPEILRPLFL